MVVVIPTSSNGWYFNIIGCQCGPAPAFTRFWNFDTLRPETPASISCEPTSFDLPICMMLLSFCCPNYEETTTPGCTWFLYRRKGTPMEIVDSCRFQFADHCQTTSFPPVMLLGRTQITYPPRCFPNVVSIAIGCQRPKYFKTFTVIFSW